MDNVQFNTLMQGFVAIDKALLALLAEMRLQRPPNIRVPGDIGETSYNAVNGLADLEKRLKQ